MCHLFRFSGVVLLNILSGNRSQANDRPGTPCHAEKHEQEADKWMA